ncbi:MAG: ammonium transporter, partial [Pseudomonadota bacterium]
ACGVFGVEAMGGLGGVGFMAQLIGSLAGATFAMIAGLILYGALKAFVGIRMDEEDEFTGADLAIHKIGANPEADIRGR